MNQPLIPIGMVKLALTSFATLLLLASCRKNDFPKEEKTVIKTDSSLPIEVAYPGLKGPMHKVPYGNDEIWLEEKGGWYFWQNDIAFSKEAFDSLKNLKPGTDRTYRTDVHMHWPGGIVPIVIDGLFSPAQVADINAAITHWNNTTSLSLVTRTNQQNYVRIKWGFPGSGWFSEEVGMKGGQQIINIEPGFSAGTVIHEIGHAIGFYHEQQRTDRGNAIIVHTQNIVGGSNAQYQFETYAQQGRNGTQFGAFDFQSIMLYHSFAFSNNVNPTMTLLDGVTTFTAQRSGLSFGDAQAAAALYGPPYFRLEYFQTSLFEQYGDLNEWVREEGGYNLRFYADPACTIPFTMPEARTVPYGVFSSSYQGLVYVALNVPAGVSFVNIPTPYYYEYRSEYGNIVSYTVNGAAGAGGAYR
jgi:hypothetical protein